MDYDIWYKVTPQELHTCPCFFTAFEFWASPKKKIWPYFLSRAKICRRVNYLHQLLFVWLSQLLTVFLSLAQPKKEQIAKLPMHHDSSFGVRSPQHFFPVDFCKNDHVMIDNVLLTKVLTAHPPTGAYRLANILNTCGISQTTVWDQKSGKRACALPCFTKFWIRNPGLWIHFVYSHYHMELNPSQRQSNICWCSSIPAERKSTSFSCNVMLFIWNSKMLPARDIIKEPMHGNFRPLS